MRRMITESDVEKLDIIQPSEIEKLSRIQDSKDSNTGNVLTVVSGGKAEYRKPATAGSRISGNSKSFQDVTIQTSDEFGKYLEIQVPTGNIITANFRWGLKMDANTYIDLGMVSISPYSNPIGGWDFVRIYISPEAITKYSITAANKFSGNIRYMYYNE